MNSRSLGAALYVSSGSNERRFRDFLVNGSSTTGGGALRGCNANCALRAQ